MRFQATRNLRLHHSDSSFWFIIQKLCLVLQTWQFGLESNHYQPNSFPVALNSIILRVRNISFILIEEITMNLKLEFLYSWKELRTLLNTWNIFLIDTYHTMINPQPGQTRSLSRRSSSITLIHTKLIDISLISKKQKSSLSHLQGHIPLWFSSNKFQHKIWCHKRYKSLNISISERNCVELFKKHL
jgi:hypothetical protein